MHREGVATRMVRMLREPGQHLMSDRPPGGRALCLLACSVAGLGIVANVSRAENKADIWPGDLFGEFSPQVAAITISCHHHISLFQHHRRYVCITLGMHRPTMWRARWRAVMWKGPRASLAWVCASSIQQKSVIQ